jgi:hypothetical protein
MFGHIPLQIVSNKDKKASERIMNKEYQRTAKSKAISTGTCAGKINEAMLLQFKQ